MLSHQHLGLARIQSAAGLGELFNTMTVFENYPVSADENDDVRGVAPGATPSGGGWRRISAQPDQRHVRRRVQPAAGLPRGSVHPRGGRGDRRPAGPAIRAVRRRSRHTAGTPGDTVHSGTHRVLEEFNQTAFDAPDGTLADWLTAQARRTPSATAVVFDGAEVSYAELHARANRIANWLIAQGIGPGDTVAVRLPRSVELVAWLMNGAAQDRRRLPAGGSGGYPADRIAYMIADAAPREVIATDTVIDSPDTEPNRRFDAGLPAYVIYTSGSTGRPKGVVVPHRAVVTRMAGMQADFGLAADDRVLQKTPSSFDVSVWEFFWPLHPGRDSGRGRAGRPPRPEVPGRTDPGPAGDDRPLRAVDAAAVPPGAGRSRMRWAAPGLLRWRGADRRPAAAVPRRPRRAAHNLTARPRPRSTSPSAPCVPDAGRPPCRSAAPVGEHPAVRAGRPAAAGRRRRAWASCTSRGARRGARLPAAGRA